MSKAPPFCWQEKRTLRRIREGIPNYASALAVYNALTEVASDCESDTFRTTQEWLGQLSGYHRRTVLRRLHDLKQIGVVEISTPAMKASSTYRLVRPRLRSDTKSQRCDTERPSQSRSLEERNGIKEERPSANGQEPAPARFAPTLLNGFRKGYEEELKRER